MKPIKTGFCLLIFCCLLQGCATMTGLQQDTKTFAHHVAETPRTLLQADLWLQEHAW